MRLVFDHKVPLTEQITTFYFKPEEPVTFTAGQYMELTLKHPKADDRGDKRWFTISSSPNEELLTVTTRIDPVKSSSFKHKLNTLEVGGELFMGGPFGDFVLPKLIQTPLVFVAGGIGITPFHSMINWLNETNETRPIQMLYAVRNEDDIIFQEEFNKANQKMTIIVSEPSPSWGGERGQLTAEMIMGLTNPSKDALVYVSGPEPMVEAIGDDLIKTGLSKAQLVQDFFPNYTRY